jgi:hypothetical protein
MENQEVLKAIATLADKVSRYHERLLKGCSCHPVIEGKPYESSTQITLTGLDSEVECEACSA